MFNSLIEIIADWSSTAKKDTAHKFLDYIMKTLNEEVLPSFDEIIASKNLPAVKSNKIFTTLYKNCNIRASNNYEALEKMRESFLYISKQNVKLKQMIDSNMQEVITDKTMTAKSAVCVRILTDINSMCSYVLDLLYFIIVDEKVSELPKIKFKRIKEGMVIFTDLFKTYGYEFSKTIESVNEVSDEIIRKDATNSTLVDAMLSSTGKSIKLPLSGFIGNPIYHVRMWFVDRASKKYESLKVKKQLIELKLMELKLDANNNSDPSLTKQIQYYEDKLANIEYNIEKYEQ